MRASEFTATQIIATLRQADAGLPTKDIYVVNTDTRTGIDPTLPSKA